jgi:Transposase.
MKRSYQKYDEEFRTNACKLVLEEGRTAVSVEHDLGLPPGTLSHWLKKHKSNASPQYTNMIAENRRLRKELDIARQERDILKKAVAIFSEPPKRSTGL